MNNWGSVPNDGNVKARGSQQEEARQMPEAARCTAMTTLDLVPSAVPVDGRKLLVSF